MSFWHELYPIIGSIVGVGAVAVLLVRLFRAEKVKAALEEWKGLAEVREKLVKELEGRVAGLEKEVEELKDDIADLKKINEDLRALNFNLQMQLKKI